MVLVHSICTIFVTTNHLMTLVSSDTPKKITIIINIILIIVVSSFKTDWLSQKTSITVRRYLNLLLNLAYGCISTKSACHKSLIPFTTTCFCEIFFELIYAAHWLQLFYSFMLIQRNCLPLNRIISYKTFNSKTKSS